LVQAFFGEPSISLSVCLSPHITLPFNPWWTLCWQQNFWSLRSKIRSLAIWIWVAWKVSFLL